MPEISLTNLEGMPYSLAIRLNSVSASGVENSVVAVLIELSEEENALTISEADSFIDSLQCACILSEERNVVTKINAINFEFISSDACKYGRFP